MPEKAPDNAELLRRRANRRLLGASVLLLIAIIAVPMFLEREPPPLPDSVDVRIPPVEGTKFEPKFPDGKKAVVEKSADTPGIAEPTGAQAGVSPVQSLPPPLPSEVSSVAAETKAPVAPSASTAAEKSSASEALKSSTKTLTTSPDKAPDKPAVNSPSDAARTSGQLIVQVIAARDPATAKLLHDKARALKFPVYTEKIDVTNGVVTRVRVGPYATKQQAESARAKLAQAGFEAKVLTLQ